MNFTFFYQWRLAGVFVMCLLSFGLSGQQVEKYTETYPNGQWKVKGKMQSGQKTAYWNFYAENGALIRKEKWHKGVFKWSIEYNEKHRRTKGVNATGDTLLYKGCNCKN